VQGDEGEECLAAKEVRETFLKRRTREVRRTKETIFLLLYESVKFFAETS
jgi:hypothetical protein